MTLFLYLGKVILGSAILYGYYRLFLRNKQFHHYNRYYLLSVLLVSIVLPFIKIPFLYQPGNAVNEAVYQTIDVLTVTNWENEATASEVNTTPAVFTLENGLYVFYIAGITIVLTLIVKSLLYIRSIRRKYKGEVINHLKFYNTREPGTPFSFFRSIFWNEQLVFNSREGQQIFRHEVFHVQQKHSADIILAELVTALFWCNPIFYLIKKEIKAIHEFLADQYAASGSDRYAYAELLVRQTLEAKNQALSNHFFQNHIKRRIAMITQFQKSSYGYWSRVMILPVSILLFCAFSLYAQQPVKNEPVMLMLQPVNDPLTIVIDPGHGGSDPGALSYDEQLKEKDIALQISKQIQQQAPGYKVNVILTRSEDMLPGNAATTQEGLKERTNLVQQTNAAAFISIHTSSASKKKQGNEYIPNPASGFEVFITNKNGDLQDQSRKLGMSIINAVSPLYTTKTSLMQRKEQGIWVLDKASCPAVIVECGYITNDKDIAFITDPANQQLIAKKLLEAVVAFKNNETVAQVTTATTSKPSFIHTVADKQPEIIAATAGYGTIDIEKVRTLKHDETTLNDVKRLFGEPGRRSLAGPYEEWYYVNTAAQLGLNFNIASQKLVAFYYKASNNNTAPLNYSAVKTIKEKETTADEVKKLFGEPAELFLAETMESWQFRNPTARMQVQFLNGKKTVEAIYYYEETGNGMKFYPDTIPQDTTKPVNIDVNVNKQENVNTQVKVIRNENNSVNKQVNVEKVKLVNKKVTVTKKVNNQVLADTSKPVNIKTNTQVIFKQGFETKSIPFNQNVILKLDSITPKFVSANALLKNIYFSPAIKIHTQPVLVQPNIQYQYRLDLNIKTDSLKMYSPQKREGKKISQLPGMGSSSTI